ncbi:MAG TPA: serine hydrolase domain-containing protein [Anaerolineales bacterium]|nr:serine hydrolase domain-containing protein [Anaerolineales bacterium]
MTDNLNQSERIEHIEHRLIQAMHNYQIPGVSIGIIHQYSIIWSRAYGVLQTGQSASVRVDSLFQACSISKAVTAAAILKLVQAGSLDLDVDVNRYLRTWKIPANDTWQPIVTLRQLLSHTAGTNVPWFYGYHHEQDIPSLVQILAGEKPANTPSIRVNTLPGTRFRYSGGGYCVLQQLLCDVQQQSFPDLMRDLVLNPVGMTQSTYEQPLPTKYWKNTASGHRASGNPLPGQWHTMPEMAAAGLWTTATDLATFSLDLQLALAGHTDRLLSPEMVRILLSPQVQHEPNGFMGLGVWLDGDGRAGRFGHPGDNEGFASRWEALREDGKGMVILTNSDNGGELIEDMLQVIAQAYDWPEIENNLSPAAPLINTSMLKYVGIYQFQSGHLSSILHLNDTLYLQMLNQSPVPLTVISETIYTLQSVDGEVVFLINDEGIVEGYLLR